MSRRVEFSRRALADLDHLDRQVRERVIIALYQFSETNQGDVLRLRGYENEWRLRVGDWRVRMQIDNEQAIINVLRVLHRREAYR